MDVYPKDILNIQKNFTPIFVTIKKYVLTTIWTYCISDKTIYELFTLTVVILKLFSIFKPIYWKNITYKYIFIF